MKWNLPVNENVSVPEAQSKDNGNDFIFLRADGKNIKLNLSDILFVESLKDYIKVATKDKTIVAKHSISALEENLPPHLFVRIHRSLSSR